MDIASTVDGAGRCRTWKRAVVVKSAQGNLDDAAFERRNPV
jgi:hypothetical protein